MKTSATHSPLDLTIPKLPKVHREPLLSKQTIKWTLWVLGATLGLGFMVLIGPLGIALVSMVSFFVMFVVNAGELLSSNTKEKELSHYQTLHEMSINDPQSKSLKRILRDYQDNRWDMSQEDKLHMMKIALTQVKTYE